MSQPLSPHGVNRSSDYIVNHREYLARWSRYSLSPIAPHVGVYGHAARAGWWWGLVDGREAQARSGEHGRPWAIRSRRVSHNILFQLLRFVIHSRTCITPQIIRSRDLYVPSFARFRLTTVRRCSSVGVWGFTPRKKIFLGAPKRAPLSLTLQPLIGFELYAVAPRGSTSRSLVKRGRFRRLQVPTSHMLPFLVSLPS